MNLDRNNPADASQDPDGDGATNLHEYLAGTNHLDPASSLRFTQISIDSQVTLRFNAIANRSYSVLYKNSLSEATWMKLADVPAPGANQVQTVADTLEPGSVRFYQLVTPAQP
jgi:hypothetical protein